MKRNLIYFLVIAFITGTGFWVNLSAAVAENSDAIASINSNASVETWIVSNEFPKTGAYSLKGLDWPAISHTCKEMLNPVAVPANAFMQFQNAYDFEYYCDAPDSCEYFDGGIVEYSTDGGSNWKNAEALFTQNGYNDFITGTSDNPLANKGAFVGFSQTYLSSKINLSSLSGQNVLFRFCIGTDSSNSIGNPSGWFIDDVSVNSFSDGFENGDGNWETVILVTPGSTTSVSSTTTIRPTTTTSVSTTTTQQTTTSVPATTTTRPTTTSSVPVTTSVPSTTTTSTGRACPFVAIADGEQGKLSSLRQYRDKVLIKTPAGREYIKQFYAHSIELTRIMMNKPAIAADAKKTLDSLEPDIRAAGQGKAVTISQAEVIKIISVLNEIGREASPELSRVIQRVKRDLRQKKVLGRMGIKVSQQ